MAEWGATQIAALASPKGLVGGPFGSALGSKDYTATGVPVIRGTNLDQGPFVGGDFVYVSEAKVRDELARNVAEPGDLVFTQRGTLGQVAVVGSSGTKRFVVSQSQMRLRVDPGRADAMFVYYACSTEGFRKQIADHAIATGVPHINLGILSRLTVPLPPLEEQRAIADVLTALDDKIAANTRLARTAGALASLLFTRVVRGIEPSSRTFGTVAEVRGGGTPSSAVPDYWDGDVPWATPTDVTALTGPYLFDTSRKITATGLANCASQLHPAGSILMTSRATIGAFALAHVPTAVNQGFIVVVPNGSVPGLWLFHEMRSRIDEFMSLANGATFLELSRGNFKSFQVRLAEPAVMAQFQEKAKALHDRAAGALRENQRLAATRDALLPALMSDRLRVRDAAETVAGPTP